MIKLAFKEFTKFTTVESTEHKISPVKSVLSGYLSEALLLMKRSPVPDDEAVHDVRVLMKKSRAALKLIAPLTGEAVFQKEYFVYRDAGRALGSLRETSVHRKVLNRLRKEKPSLFAGLKNNLVIEGLFNSVDNSKIITKEVLDAIEEGTVSLRGSAFRIRFLHLGDVPADLCFRELEKSYKAAGLTYLACRSEGRPQRLHRLRKKVKDLLYQLYVFRPLNNTKVRSLEKKLDALSQQLGVYNDLTQLLLVLGYDHGNQDNSADLNKLMIFIREKQDEALEKIWPVAYKVFCPGLKLSDILGILPAADQQPPHEVLGENDL